MALTVRVFSSYWKGRMYPGGAPAPSGILVVVGTIASAIRGEAAARPYFQLSLAIGKEGQNARLAARLTGVRIDIKSETQAANEANGIFEPRQSPRNTEYAEGEWRKNDETGELQFHNTDGSVVSEQEWAGGSSSDSESTEA